MDFFTRNLTAGVGKAFDTDVFLVGVLGTTKITAVCGLISGEDEPESIANAFLYAGAPDLLDAAERLLAHLDCVGMTRKDESFMDDLREKIAACRQTETLASLA